MYRSQAMWPPRLVLAAAALALLAVCHAGPLGPLPNVTSADLGLKEGGCAVGDVVYGSGESVPGTDACERCACAAGRVRCERPQCEPRPGCKALHRPDHCCPTYQCECEQEGRVYGNGEKLVDPADPCRVCYCQGGEVVCRRIACFLRDDCSPRLVPGRCCPEYDNCPLRGVTAVPGATSSISTIDEVMSSLAPSPPRETVKQEITIKEITPVSEIPVITEVKIKEILPSPAIEVPDYSSSKSPLMVREATSEATVAFESTPFIIKVQPASTTSASEFSSTFEITIKPSEASTETKATNDSTPSKISLSTQDSINSDIFPSIMSSASTMGAPPITPEVVVAPITSKPSVIEEEDPALFDHNPAFPPLPDDLSVIGNHEDELVSEQGTDADHVSAQDAGPFPTPAHAATARTSDAFTTTNAPKTMVETSTHLSDTQDLGIDERTNFVSQSTIDSFNSSPLPTTIGTYTTKAKDSPMLNLRSAIPTEILNVPSYVPEEINGELDDISVSSTADEQDMSQRNPVTTHGSVEITTTSADDATEGRTSQESTASDVTQQSTVTVSDLTQSSEATTHDVTQGSETTSRNVMEGKTVTSRVIIEDVSATTRGITDEIIATKGDGTESKEVLTTAEPITTSTSVVKTVRVKGKTTQTKPVPGTTTTVSNINPMTTKAYVTTFRAPDTTVAYPSSTPTAQQEPTAAVANVEPKANIVTEITAQTEFSSIPIETSDQNPQENMDTFDKQKPVPSTTDPWPVEQTSTNNPTNPMETEIITVSRDAPSSTNTLVSQSYENVETTEFLLTSFGSSETATDAVELIKISAQPEQSAAVIDPVQRKQTNVLSDLIDLVGDVASIGDRTDGSSPTPPAHSASIVSGPTPTAVAGIPDSEELIPVNAGYKSKNFNWNVNSITEIPVKSKSPSSSGNKQKVVEIEDDDDTITDAPPPDDKVEPTTRRPIIDNVSDVGRQGNETDKKDIEIITKSYVPTINRRPTKVVMKKSNDKPVLGEEVEGEPTAVTATESGATATDSGLNDKRETTVAERASSSTETSSERGTQSPNKDTIVH